jgi:hypothetical protein
MTEDPQDLYFERQKIATRSLIKFCRDHGNDVQSVRLLDRCLEALELGQVEAALSYYKSIPLGGMGCFNDWLPPAVNASETVSGASATFDSLVSEWALSMRILETGGQLASREVDSCDGYSGSAVPFMHTVEDSGNWRINTLNYFLIVLYSFFSVVDFFVNDRLHRIVESEMLLVTAPLFVTFILLLIVSLKNAKVVAGRIGLAVLAVTILVSYGLEFFRK